MQLFGHTTTHKPQPLHRSVSITILPAIFRIVYCISYFVSRFTGDFLRKGRILTGLDVAVK